MKMLHEPHNRAMWHDDCPDARAQGGRKSINSPMAPDSVTMVRADGARGRIWRCVVCEQPGFWSVRTDGRSFFSQAI